MSNNSQSLISKKNVVPNKRVSNATFILVYFCTFQELEHIQRTTIE